MNEELFKEHYWEIELWNGEKISVRPQNADKVQNKLATGEGFINTKTMSINVKDVKSFNETDRQYTDQKLLEGAAQAFKEPIIIKGTYKFGDQDIPYEAVECRWCKKTVSKRKWETYYHAMSSYHLLNDDDNHVTIAFLVPTHNIDYSKVTELSPEEIKMLHLQSPQSAH